MSDDQKTKIAKEYVDRQIETMKRYGSVTRELSKKEYEMMVKKAAEMVRT